MDDELLPDGVRDFILRHVDSVGHLEALLLLWRAQDRKWDVLSVAQQLYIREPAAAEILERLHSLNLILAERGHYYFSSEAADLCSEIANLADAYARNLIEVTRLIHSRPATRIQEFADAFKLRKGN